jgi:hypothetical protein
MLDRVEDLPWGKHWKLLCRAAKAVFTTGIVADLDISWHRDTTATDMAAIRTEAAAMMSLLTVLVLLSLAGQHKHPGGVLLALLWVLGALSIKPGPAVPPLSASACDQGTWS